MHRSVMVIVSSKSMHMYTELSITIQVTLLWVDPKSYKYQFELYIITISGEVMAVIGVVHTTIIIVMSYNPLVLSHTFSSMQWKR